MAEIPKNRREWGLLEAGLEERTPVGVVVEMDPASAQVREALHLSFSVSPISEAWGPGTDLLVLVPRIWQLDLNGAFPEISQFFAVRTDGYGNGRQCLVAAEASVPQVGTSCELIPAGFEFLVHVRLEDAALPAGERLRIHLSHPDGPRVRTPQTAQFHPFITAVRIGEADGFRPVSDTPGVHTHGGCTRSFRVTSRAVVGADETPSFKVVPMDLYGMNRGFDFEGEVALAEVGTDAPGSKASISRDESFTRIEVPLRGQGPFRYVGARDLSGDLVGRSNPVGRPECFGGHRVFFGDLHVHCRPCDGFGTMQEAYDYAYEISELDFASVSHQHNSANFAFTRSHWEEYLAINERYNGKERFATLPVCEHYSPYGHRHVLFATREDAARFPIGAGSFRGPYDPANHPHRLWSSLTDLEALTFPHHLKFIHGTDFDIPPNPLEPVMEICSRWGISETGGRHSARHALSQGRRMGFLGGTDNHLGQPGSGTHGYNEGRGWTAVLTHSLARREIFEAIRSRRCYATTGAKILLFFALGDHLMGEERVGWEGDRVFRIRAAGTAPISRIELIRNGRVALESRPETYTVETEFRDSEPLEGLYREPAFPGLAPFCYYYARVTQRDREQAWSSPIWVSRQP